MTYIVDLVVVGVVLISALLASLRGFTREILAIGSWVVAVIVAYLTYKQLAPFVAEQIPSIAERQYAPEGIAAGIVFIITLIIAYMLTGRLSEMVLDSRIGALDRTFGFVFGALRGLLLMIIAFSFFQFFAGAASNVYMDSAKTKPVLAAGAEKLKGLIPEDMDSYFNKLSKTKAGNAPKDGDGLPVSVPGNIKK